MPANRSRTTEWRRSMQQVFERGGTLEIAVARQGASGHDPAEHVSSADLVFRLRIVSLLEDCVVVEAPSALGRTIHIEDGAPLVGAITIGQNRWKFRSCKLSGEPAGRVEAMRLELPDEVERCLRRFTRFEVGGLNLPEVEVYPLLDAKSVARVEEWNDAAFAAAEAGRTAPPGTQPLPTVGPKFTATLMNVGGGGIGIRVEPVDASALTRHRMFWFCIPLEKSDPLPVVATGKVVHTHLDSTQRTYAGVSFDFSFRPAHQKTVVEQVVRHMERSQQRPT